MCSSSSESLGFISLCFCICSMVVEMKIPKVPPQIMTSNSTQSKFSGFSVTTLGMGVLSLLRDANILSAIRKPSKTSPGSWERISSVRDIIVNYKAEMLNALHILVILL